MEYRELWIDSWKNGAFGRALFEILWMQSDLNVYKRLNIQVQTFAAQARLGHSD